MNTKNKTFFTAKNVATFGILVALVVVLQLFASAVPMFGITMNFSLIPIVLAAIFFGPAGGAFLGFVSGMVTYITCAIMGGEPLTAYLFQNSPVMLTIICVGKTTAAGAVAGLVYNIISKKNKIVAAYVSSLLVPVLNTGLYLLGMMVLQRHASAFLGTEATAGAVFLFIFGIIWLNFLLEIAVNIVLSPAIVSVVRVIEKRAPKKKA